MYARGELLGEVRAKEAFMISAGKSVGPTDAQIQKFVAAQVKAGADEATIKAALATRFPETASDGHLIDKYDGKVADMIAAARKKMAKKDGAPSHPLLTPRKMGSLGPSELKLTPAQNYMAQLLPHMDSWRSQLRKCTQEAGSVSGGPTGNITFTIQVGADGKVTASPKIQIAGDDPRLQKAAERVAAQIARAQLPRPPGGDAIVLEIPYTIKETKDTKRP